MTSTKPPCEFITGEAGTGKSYLVQERVAADPKYGALCATTGVAAVNTGSITINSLLRYGMDYHALLDAYMTERLHRRLWQLDQTYQRIILDEAPMYSGRALDILYKALCERKLNLGLTLVGDFAQLPPINEPWIFQAKCWGRFAANTTRLTKNWRQEGGNFLTALNAIRVGDGGTTLFPERPSSPATPTLTVTTSWPTNESGEHLWQSDPIVGVSNDPSGIPRRG
jgi:hypothetical protein